MHDPYLATTLANEYLRLALQQRLVTNPNLIADTEVEFTLFGDEAPQRLGTLEAAIFLRGLVTGNRISPLLSAAV